MHTDYETVNVTRTEETKAQYRAIYARLLKLTEDEIRRHDLLLQQDLDECVLVDPTSAIATTPDDPNRTRSTRSSTPTPMLLPAHPTPPKTGQLTSRKPRRRPKTVSELASQDDGEKRHTPYRCTRSFRPSSPTKASGPNEPSGCTGPPSSSPWKSPTTPISRRSGIDCFTATRTAMRLPTTATRSSSSDAGCAAAPRTSARKAKRFSQRGRRRTDCRHPQYQQRVGRCDSDLVCRWILVGLRPWSGKAPGIDQNEAGNPILVVDNAKHTNGRSHGDTRTLNLEGLDADQLELVTKQVNIAVNYARLGAFANYYERCREVLHRRGRAPSVAGIECATPPSTPEAHVHRQRQSVFGRIEVAALLGHASVKTAKLHYARRRLGSGVMGVRPTENDIAAVAKRNPDIKPETAAASASRRNSKRSRVSDARRQRWPARLPFRPGGSE